MSEITLPLAQYEALAADAAKWRQHVQREEARQRLAVANFLAEGQQAELCRVAYAGDAPVAQRTEQGPSKAQDAGSNPVGGATLTQRVAAVTSGFGGPDRRMTERQGRCQHGFPLGMHCHDRV